MLERTRPESATGPVRHYAGVLVSTDALCFAAVRQAVAALAGVQVHHSDPATGRLVAVLESADRAEGERLFTALGRIPDVRSVDLVYHLVDREDGDVAFVEPDLEPET